MAAIGNNVTGAILASCKRPCQSLVPVTNKPVLILVTEYWRTLFVSSAGHGTAHVCNPSTKEAEDQVPG